jgi:hypothetical protein
MLLLLLEVGLGDTKKKKSREEGIHFPKEKGKAQDLRREQLNSMNATTQLLLRNLFMTNPESNK